MTQHWKDTRTKKLGIFGGGQLGFMLGESARTMGLERAVFCQSVNEPTVGTVEDVVIGDWDERSALTKFAETGIEWLVGEFENADPNSVEFLASLGVKTYTMAPVLRIGRDRLQEKMLAQEEGVPVTKYTTFEGHNVAEVLGRQNAAEWANILISKTRTLGYDGKGQVSFTNGLAEIIDFATNTEGWPDDLKLIVEERVNFAFECSVCVVRAPDGTIKYSPAVYNRHTSRHGGGILEYSMWYPGAVDRAAEAKAQEYAVRLAEKLKLVGVITVEFFVTHDGIVMFNELAPRVHNSFHGSREAANTNQFDWHVASVVGEPLADMEFFGPWVMVNLISEDIDQKRALRRNGFKVTDYLKGDYGKARKMGHATKVLPQDGDVGETLKGLYDLKLITR